MRNPTELKETFGRYSKDNGLKSRIYKQLKQLNTNRTKNPINKLNSDEG
jgi:hypothetical protein